MSFVEGVKGTIQGSVKWYFLFREQFGDCYQIYKVLLGLNFRTLIKFP